MAVMQAVATWRCKCGIRIKVTAEIDTNAPLKTQVATCPHCGDGQTVYADKIITVRQDTLEVRD